MHTETQARFHYDEFCLPPHAATAYTSSRDAIRNLNTVVGIRTFQYLCQCKRRRPSPWRQLHSQELRGWWIQFSRIHWRYMHSLSRKTETMMTLKKAAA